jgi:hypothetical protein
MSLLPWRPLLRKESRMLLVIGTCQDACGIVLRLPVLHSCVKAAAGDLPPARTKSSRQLTAESKSL